MNKIICSVNLIFKNRKK